ncbi:MAG: 2-oxoacid:ferredoxin oxidoreductase subunit beta [Bacteroidetes bacterium]|nr:2-oxoacid:ferredoxin oxidoreductase subunit beta [Bacteroidota bacterium]
MENNIDVEEVKYKAKDFASDQDVRWCPGCGDYSVLAQVQRVFPEIGVKKEDIAWISGIGCSSRFPYYMSTYGFHSIHGRALAIATGLKTARPDLSVWVATGDGDNMSIGGNHFIHTCRKNVDLNVLMFNNQIYGLTKGQYSPTSEEGKVTKSSPYGSVDHPFNPPSLALGAEATFVARAIDTNAKHLQEVLKKAMQHKGTSFVEIYQNCNIFNDGAFDELKDKETKLDHLLTLEDGQPMIFGKNSDKGIKFDCDGISVIDLNDKNNSIEDVMIHRETDINPMRAFILANMTYDHSMPTPVGVFRRVQKSTYDESVKVQLEKVTAKKGVGTLQNLLYSGNTWEV